MIEEVNNLTGQETTTRDVIVGSELKVFLLLSIFRAMNQPKLNSIQQFFTQQFFFIQRVCYDEWVGVFESAIHRCLVDDDPSLDRVGEGVPELYARITLACVFGTRVVDDTLCGPSACHDVGATSVFGRPGWFVFEAVVPPARIVPSVGHRYDISEETVFHGENLVPRHEYGMVYKG